ncbi:mRNA 3'-end-processing protein rna14 [Vermiconidia calcicola]|uniref:mRNA 3'-end-processing protein rna14 n=1 Tax=Vermiconidia calcicola TaxID=1690605 RepID=A0ACC3NEM7_9PEZI|nr:mRNA 3'-end-processing protein rna14 [Vermiconidia calcicola]
MADYDPTAPLTLDANAADGDANGEYQYNHADDDEEEDDDYDPSSFSFNDGDGDAHMSQDEQQKPMQRTPAQPIKPKTVGGFIVDDDDEDEEEQQQDAVPPPPSQMNGTEGAQSGLGAVAVSEAASAMAPQNTVIASEPSQEDASAPSAAPLNGSSSVVVPAPVSSDTSSFTLFAPAPSSTEQGKQQANIISATASATPSAAATPQPPPAAAAATTSATALTNGSVPPTPTTQRLPHDKVGQLEDRIKEDPKADTEAWRELIKHYREKGQLDNARRMYTRFFEVFPTAAQVWIEYVQMELAENNLRNVEQIFGQCLLNLPNIDMWTTYLDYLRRIHPLINDPDGAKRGIISQAFEVLLEHVGIDPESGKLWRDYVDFIKGGPGTMGGTGWQDAQKMDMLRKVYQKAIRIPHSELTKLWKEYDNFEIGINKTSGGRKFLQEQSPYYMTARTAKTQLDYKIEGLDRMSLPVLPPVYGCAGEDEFATQVEKWRAWLEWEKEDPLVLKDEDIAAFRKRVVYVYKQATMQLRFYPQIWFEASVWCVEQGTPEMEKEGEEFLTRGMEACPESVLLALKKADRVEGGLEKSNEDEVAIRNGEKLDPVFEGCHKALYALYKKILERLNKEVAKVNEYFANLPPEEEQEEQMKEGSDDDDEEDERPKPQTRAEQLKAQLEAAKAPITRAQEELKNTISYLWVAKLRAFRRIQGQGQPNKAKKGFRGVFAEARPRGQLTSEVYIASALMEWRCYQDRSAEKIFERGLKLFPTDEVFALEYIKHLISNNDDTNARAVFETTMTKIVNATSRELEKQRQKCRPLLTYMHDFESNYGDLDKIHRVEKRMKEMYPDEPDVSRFGARYALPSFDGMSAQLVISPTQARPAPPQAMIEQSNDIRLGPNGPYIARSPKRALDDSDSEGPARKFMRGDSPLKGAAGRRMQGHQPSSSITAAAPAPLGGFATKNYVPAAAAPPVVHPSPLPYDLHSLLSRMPHASQYRSTLFDPGKLVEYLKGVDVEGARIRFGVR